MTKVWAIEEIKALLAVNLVYTRLDHFQHAQAQSEAITHLLARVQELEERLKPKNPIVYLCTYGDGDWETMMMAVGPGCEGWGLHTLQEVLEDLQENCPDDLYASGEYTIEILGYQEPEQVAENYSHPGYWEFNVLSYQKHSYDTPEFQEGISAFQQAVKDLPEFDWSDMHNFWANRQKRDDLLQEARTHCPYPEGRQKECWLDGWDSQKDQVET